ncbi:MAG: rod-binding protein [Lachnospiraceae bacterium]|nr:rod-binding protein [Lachnospiraceae bacterium]
MDIGGVGSVYADYMASQVSSTKADTIKNKIENSAGAANEEELLDACKQFESYFLEQVFKEMLKTTKVFSDDDENGYASKMVDYFKDSAVQHLCEQATSGDGLGLANMLYEQMKRNYGIGVEVLLPEEV